MHLLENKQRSGGMLPLKTSYSNWEMLFGGWYWSRRQVSLGAVCPNAVFNFTGFLDHQEEEEGDIARILSWASKCHTPKSSWWCNAEHHQPGYPELLISWCWNTWAASPCWMQVAKYLQMALLVASLQLKVMYGLNVLRKRGEMVFLWQDPAGGLSCC